MAKMSTSEKALLSGNEALVHGAYEAGLSVACAYPGTPSTEILETLAQFPDVDVQWSVNEKVTFEVALGAAIAGARSLFACKHVGLNVAMDPLMTSSYTGVQAGFVVVVCDDPGMHSSQNEQDTRWVALYAKVPMLEPSSPSEVKEFVKEAFKISERYDTPVIVRMTTRVSHTKENVTLGKREVPPRPEFERNIPKYVMVPGNAYQRHILVEKRETSTACSIIRSDEIKHLNEIREKIRREIENVLSIGVKVTLVEPKTIKRSEGKAQCIVDKRTV